MKRYILQDGSAVVRSERGDWVRYADALAESCPQDAQEGFRAFLARRGVAKFHSLYGAVLHEIDAMEQDDQSAKILVNLALAHLDVDVDSGCRLVDACDYLKSRTEALPADWSKDSSLETWFPLSAQRIKELEIERDRFKKDAEFYMAALNEWRDQESIRNGDLTQQLAIELKRNAMLREELEKEVQKTADAYSAMHKMSEEKQSE